MRRARSREDVAGACGLPDRLKQCARMGVDGLLVGTVTEIDARLALPEGVPFVGQGQAIGVLRQAFAIDADTCQTVVAQQRCDQVPAPQAGTARQRVRERDRLYAQALHQIAADEAGIRRAHHVFGNERRWIPSIHAHVCVELTPHLGRHVRHEIAPHLPAGVGQPQVEQQARCLHTSCAQEDGAAALAILLPMLAIGHRSRCAVAVAFKIDYPAVGAQLRTMRFGQRQPCDVHAHLGGVAAALVTGTTVVASRTLAPMRLLMRPGDQRGGCIGGPDAKCAATAFHGRGRRIALWWPIRIAALGVPRIMHGTGDPDEGLHATNVSDQLMMRDRPVGALPCLGQKAEIALVRPWTKSAPMQRRTTEPGARIIRPERSGRLPTAQALVHPIDAGGQLIGNVRIRRKCRAGFQYDHRNAGLRKPRCERASPRSAADHHHIDAVLTTSVAHWAVSGARNCQCSSRPAAVST